METAIEKECSALGGLFQSIITDLRNGVPIWEDFLGKAVKLHGQLKATIIATTAFLDAFQKIADLATNTRGATKDIGTALTRLCLRHKAVEAKTKTFTSALMECLVMPLQDKMEEWKKTVNHLDKEHAKDYKRARQEIKKLSSDTLRLQKKVRKGRGKNELQRSLDIALHNVNDKFHALEETEKQTLRTALIEERSRFCLFVSFLKPVVDEEVAMLSETSHFQEIMENLLRNINDPYTLPPASEQIVSDIKILEGSWTFHTPPSSPSSISSRKSSTCSVSSVTSSSSGSTKCYSPGVHNRCRSLSQQPMVMGTLRLTSVSSQDSGFTSQDTLFLRPRTPPALEQNLNVVVQNHNVTSSVSTPSSPYGILPAVTATWPNLQETGHFNKVPCPGVGDRPHTISTAYERGHQRPPLTIHTFEPLDKSPSRQVISTPSSPQDYDGVDGSRCPGMNTANENGQPTIPKRAVSISKPSIPSKSSKLLDAKSVGYFAPTNLKFAALPDFNQPAPNQIVPQPLYVNMDEITVKTPQSDSSQSQSEDHQRFTSSEEDVYDYRQNDISTESYLSSKADLVSTLEQNLSNASKYCTIPRYSNLSQTRHPSLNRRHFTTGSQNSGNYATLQHRTSSLRRSSSQSHKPPPPVRRTSSITSQHALTIVQLRNAQSSQNLSSSTSSLGSAREIDFAHSGSVNDVNDYNIMQNSSIVEEPRVQVLSNGQNERGVYPKEVPIYRDNFDLPDPPSDLSNSSSPVMTRKGSLSFESPKFNRKLSLVEESVVRNKTTLIQSLQERISESKQPQQSHSPTTQEKKLSKLNLVPAVEKSPTLSLRKTSIPNTNNTEKDVKESFIQNLNPKLALHIQRNSRPTSPPPVSPRPNKSEPQSSENQATECKRLTFKDELNARLMLQQQGISGSESQSQPKVSNKPSQPIGNGVTSRPQHHSQQSSVDKIQPSRGSGAPSKGRQWVATRVPCDPVTNHESLLDQIKRGAALRKTMTNDRSAPKIR